MSKLEDRLVSDMSELVAASEDLRQTLARYKRANQQLSTRIGKGENVLDAFDAMTGPMRRHRELTEAMEQFEAARHQVRLSLFALADAEGVSKSDVARRLGVSRQLASRLAAEAALGRRRSGPARGAEAARKGR